MEVSMRKRFFSKHKMRLWLDTLGQKGYLLTDKRKSRYTFTVDEEHIYYYSVNYLDHPVDSDEGNAYCSDISGQGIIPVYGNGRWLVKASEDNPFEGNSEEYRKNSIPYLVRSVYIYFFTLVLCGICGYQFHEIAVLASEGATASPNLITAISDSSNAVLNFFIAIVNFFIGLLNSYFGLWYDIFGYRGAVAVISVLIPVIIILAVIGGINFAEYLVYRREYKSALKSEEITAVDNVVEQDLTNAEESDGE